jgi:hypothetical protein
MIVHLRLPVTGLGGGKITKWPQIFPELYLFAKWNMRGYGQCLKIQQLLNYISTFKLKTMQDTEADLAVGKISPVI